MATQSQNLKLVKPDKTDFYDIEVFNRNMDIIDNEIKELKPKIILGEGEGEWKRVTIVIPELQFTYWVENNGSQKRTYATVTLDDYIDEIIQDAIVVNVCTQYRSYMNSPNCKDIGVKYCAKVPDDTWQVFLIDRDTTESNFITFIVIDVLYRV